MTIDSTTPPRVSGPLLSPTNVGPLSLPNRVLMAPMTRSRADAVGNPTSIMAEYYEQRASAGLIISEGIVISPQGKGYPNTPGIFTDEQTAEWTRIVDAVHEAAGSSRSSGTWVESRTPLCSPTARCRSRPPRSPLRDSSTLPRG